MNRRSFLQFLGLAPIAPAVIASMPAEPILGYFNGLPVTAFRGVNAELYGRGPMMASMELDAVWFTETISMPPAEEHWLTFNEPDRIPPALRA